MMTRDMFLASNVISVARRLPTSVFGAATLLSLLFAGPTDTAAAADAAFRSFLQQHCLECHSSPEHEGDVRLDTLAGPTASGPAAETWARVIGVIENGEMPPEDQPQPDAAEVQQAVRQITRAMAESATSKPIALRRLNRRE